MENKTGLLKELKNVKIILGNGFDLYCGLKTRYQDFFSQCKEVFPIIRKWKDSTDELFWDERRNYDPPLNEIDIPKEFAGCNLWLVFFLLVTDERTQHNWCDVEEGILNSVSLNTISFFPSWPIVLDTLQKGRSNGSNLEESLLAAFILSEHGQRFPSFPSFYEYLLEQLKEFETLFGRYVMGQHLRHDQFMYHYNDRYILNARTFFEFICDPNEIVSIDCFNYAFTPEPKFFDKCRFINGDARNPIFGVDTVFEPSDYGYIFTKTNRRIELDMEESTSQETPSFDNAIVFGHSLSSHDYSYFFPVLDQLEMTSNVSHKKIVFAYSVYDLSKESDIKKRVRKGIYDLFYTYAKERQITNPNRLLDSITSQGRIMMFEAPPAGKADVAFQNKIDNWITKDPGAIVYQKWQDYQGHGKTLILKGGGTL